MKWRVEKAGKTSPVPTGISHGNNMKVGMSSDTPGLNDRMQTEMSPVRRKSLTGCWMVHSAMIGAEAVDVVGMDASAGGYLAVVDGQ